MPLERPAHDHRVRLHFLEHGAMIVAKTRRRMALLLAPSHQGLGAVAAVADHDDARAFDLSQLREHAREMPAAANHGDPAHANKPNRITREVRPPRGAFAPGPPPDPTASPAPAAPRTN